MPRAFAIRCLLAGALAVPLLPASFATSAVAQSSCGDVWRVSPGDTLASISRACGVPIRIIQAINPQIDWNRLPVGARVALNPRTAGRPTAPAPARPEAYIVRPGDTLSSIARAFNIPLQDLLRANPGLTDRDLQVGRTIYFAERGGPRPSPGRPAPAPTRIDVSLDDRNAEPGGFAVLRVSGLRPGAEISVEAGPIRGRGGAEGSARASRRGNAEVELDIPRRAEPGERWAYEVLDERGRVIADGDFRLAGGRPGRPGRPDGAGDGRALRVTGIISNEGVECPAIRGEDGRLYTLAGGLDGFRPGDRVTVTGRATDVSTCQQGLTIAVESIRPAR